jgi:hypothetical protein
MAVLVSDLPKREEVLYFIGAKHIFHLELEATSACRISLELVVGRLNAMFSVEREDVVWTRCWTCSFPAR